MILDLSDYPLIVTNGNVWSPTRGLLFSISCNDPALAADIVFRLNENLTRGMTCRGQVVLMEEQPDGSMVIR